MMYLRDKILYLGKGLYSKNAYKSIGSISRRTRRGEWYILIKKEESRYIVMIQKQ